MLSDSSATLSCVGLRWKYNHNLICMTKLHVMRYMEQITFLFLILCIKRRFSRGSLRDIPLTSPCGISFHLCPTGLCWPFPASVSIVSPAMTSDHCVCVCRSPQRCTCSATPRARGTNRPCEIVAASRDGSSLMRKWCVSHTPCREQTSTHPVKEYSCLCHVKRQRQSVCLLWRGHYYCLCIPLYTATAPLLALSDYKWGLKCTQLGFSASVVGVTSPPCLQAVFVMERLSIGWQLVNAR